MFNKNKFLFGLDQELLKDKMYKTHKIYKCINDMFKTFTGVFRLVLDKHAPLKTKIIRRNQAPFMTKAVSKAIITSSRLRSKFNKWQS